MIIQHHQVTDYRNILGAELEPSPHITVISGENGQGKTNLLESVWLLSGAKSFRGSKDGELIRRGQPFSRILSEVSSDEQSKTVEIRINGEESEKKGRYAWVNGVEMGRAAALAGQFFSVVFAPAHLSLVKGPPEGRRRFIDAALCQLYPGYIGVLRRYTRLLQQKNALLKELRRQQTAAGLDLLDVMDQELSVYGCELSLRRADYIQKIAPPAMEEYVRISRGREELVLAYRPTALKKEELFTALVRQRAEDIRAGFCTVGPHREDLVLQLDKEDARIFASQGQQRSIVLCLKLAEAGEVQRVSGEAPVILLDDVLSELDVHRQDYLLNQLPRQQVIVTSCDSDLFAKTNGRIYEMKEGRLTEKE